jgi:histidinol-phosphate aminotransferase
MKTTTDLALAHIAQLQPYIPGMSIEELARTYNLDPDSIIKLASNENPNGPSPMVSAAITHDLAHSNRYPDGYDLYASLARHYGLETDHFIVGNGSNEILDLIARVFLSAGDNAVSSQYAFFVYSLETQLVGATNKIVPAINYGHDLSKLKEAIDEHTKIVWIANPNNPTGTFIPYPEIHSFLEAVPSDVLVVLDEAYYEYLTPDNKVETQGWVDEFCNLILTRTFSKVYGLAGLRIGYAIANPEIIQLLQRARQPFNVSTAGLLAAQAALSDQDYVKTASHANQAGLAYVTGQLDSMNIPYLPTFGNFVTIELIDVPDVCQKMLQQGIIIRPLPNYAMTHHVRVTVGLQSENEAFIAALREILAITQPKI